MSTNDFSSITGLLPPWLPPHIVESAYENQLIPRLIQLAPELPTLADAFGISVTALVLVILSYGTHGRDNRTPIHKLHTVFAMHVAARRTAKSVAFVASRDVLSFAGSYARLITAPETMDGQFAHERCVPETHPATAFLVAPRFAVTAGHAVCFRDPARLHLVFGFGTESTLSDDDAYYLLPRRNAVRVKQVVSLRYNTQIGDIALIELARPVLPEVATPATIAPRKSTKFLQEVAALSHARAQPLKAIVRPWPMPPQNCPMNYPAILDQNRRFLGTNLDTYRGSSGSPVIDSQGRVVAVQVRGFQDQSGGHQIPYPEMVAGSWATRIELLAEELAAIGVPLPP
jgi:hypothetical protein